MKRNLSFTLTYDILSSINAVKKLSGNSNIKWLALMNIRWMFWQLSEVVVDSYVDHTLADILYHLDGGGAAAGFGRGGGVGGGGAVGHTAAHYLPLL